MKITIEKIEGEMYIEVALSSEDLAKMDEGQMRHTTQYFKDWPYNIAIMRDEDA